VARLCVHVQLYLVNLKFMISANSLYVLYGFVELLWKFARILLKKSGTRVPRVELEEVGPSADLVLRRTKIASDDLYRRAKKQPDAAKACFHVYTLLAFSKSCLNESLEIPISPGKPLTQLHAGLMWQIRSPTSSA